MKRSRLNLDNAIEHLLAHPATIPAGWDSALIDQPYLTRLDRCIRELVAISVEPDHKDRHGVKWMVRSNHICENASPDLPVPKLPDDATPEQEDRALEWAAVNVEYATKVLSGVARDRRYRREIKKAP